MSVEPRVTTRPNLTHRADVPVALPAWQAVGLRPLVLVCALFFVIFGASSLELGPIEARLGLASGEWLGPFGRVFGYWDPSLWPLSVTLGRIWAYFEEAGPSQNVVRWPSAIASVIIGVMLARRARLEVGPRAGVLVALTWFGSFAMMDRSASTGLDLIAGLGTIAALDRLLAKGAGWAVGVWASLAFLAAGWPPLAVIALATVVVGRSKTTWSWSMTTPVLLTIAGWSAWALATAPAEAWASALALPITQSSAWTLILGVAALGLPWTPFVLLARSATIRESWVKEGRVLVIGWLQVAGACLIVGTVVPGLSSAATIPALAGLAIVTACCWDRAWALSSELPTGVRRWTIGLALVVSGLWLTIALGWGGYVGFAVAYYRSTLITVGILSLVGFLMSVHAARFGEVRWALGGVVVVTIALKLAHWGYFVPELNYRNGAGPWGRAIGQWVPEKHPIYVLHPWSADLAFAIGRPVRQLLSPGHIEYQPGQGSKFVLLQDSEYVEYTTWEQGWPKLIKVAQFEDETGFGHRFLMRTDAPLVVERPYRKHDPRE